MIFHHLHRINDHVILLGNPYKQLLGAVDYLGRQDLLAILRNPDRMVIEIVDRMLASSQGTRALSVP